MLLRGEEDSSRKAKKRKREENAAEAEYEQLPRPHSGTLQKKMKALLPIKGKEGLVPQMVEVEEGEFWLHDWLNAAVTNMVTMDK